MSINQVQFQKGLSIADFMERYGKQKKCHAALVAMKHKLLQVMCEREESRQLDGRV